MISLGMSFAIADLPLTNHPNYYKVLLNAASWIIRLNNRYGNIQHIIKFANISY